ncbi:transmembrane protein 196-like isoform X1 [Strongylocentrotus purpuratus]|uniref:Transmembrane protein 196 n=1 Tax=Strongylocentrotus purpuratus TaxID=7668 RepID=A0A7M7HKC7_STRPU|nr:transmembrane protein 196-like isoform X1 [Strongylocentrotus purpuratus]
MVSGVVDTSTSSDNPDGGEKRNITCFRCCSATALLVLLSVPHMILGLPSMVVGVILYSDAHIWLAHTVSPIWSGVCFFFCGVFGIVSAKRTSPYTIFCFSSFCIISLMVSIIDMQLLRLGLVNHTTDGQTFLKDNVDPVIRIALGIAGGESFICALSALFSCLVGQHVRRTLRSGGTRVVSNEHLVAQRQEQIRQEKEAPNRSGWLVIRTTLPLLSSKSRDHGLDKD